MNVWVQSPLCVRETCAAQAICYGELSREAKISHLPSHSEIWPSAAQPGTLAQQPVAAHFGICRERLSPEKLIILASMEGLKCIYKVN